MDSMAGPVPPQLLRKCEPPQLAPVCTSGLQPEPSQYHNGQATVADGHSHRLQDARDKRVEIVSRLNRGERVTPTKATLREYADEWLEGQAAKLRPSTHGRYEVFSASTSTRASAVGG